MGERAECGGGGGGRRGGGIWVLSSKVREWEEREARGGEKAGEGQRHNRSISMAHFYVVRHKQLNIKVIRIVCVVMDRTTHMA